MNRTDFEESWIGKGMQMPNPFNKVTGTVITNTGKDRIKQSIFYILSTIIGERYLVPDFGSNLYRLIFEPNDDVLEDLAITYVKEALGKWEPRIEVLNVDVNTEVEGNTIPITITYRITSTNIIDNYVYPFVSQARQLGGDFSE